jgi:hypothetical protein
MKPMEGGTVKPGGEILPERLNILENRRKWENISEAAQILYVLPTGPSVYLKLCTLKVFLNVSL